MNGIHWFEKEVKEQLPDTSALMSHPVREGKSSRLELKLGRRKVVVKASPSKLSVSIEDPGMPAGANQVLLDAVIALFKLPQSNHD